MTDRGLYGRAGNAWSTRLGGDHFHPGGEAATAALLTAARGFGFGAVPFVLDVGCGAGGPARTLARRLGTDVVGVDVGGELLRRAHAAARADELWLRCGFVRATVMSLPFADASVPALWSVGALVHAEVAAALTEVARVAAPGALFALADWVCAEDMTDEDRENVAQLEYRLVPPVAYQAALERAGFAVLLAEPEPPPEPLATVPRDEHAWQTQFLLRFGPRALHAELTRSRAWSSLVQRERVAHWRFIARRR